MGTLGGINFITLMAIFTLVEFSEAQFGASVGGSVGGSVSGSAGIDATVTTKLKLESGYDGWVNYKNVKRIKIIEGVRATFAQAHRICEKIFPFEHLSGRAHPSHLLIVESIEELHFYHLLLQRKGSIWVQYPQKIPPVITPLNRLKYWRNLPCSQYNPNQKIRKFVTRQCRDKVRTIVCENKQFLSLEETLRGFDRSIRSINLEFIDINLKLAAMAKLMGNANANAGFNFGFPGAAAGGGMMRPPGAAGGMQMMRPPGAAGGMQMMSPPGAAGGMQMMRPPGAAGGMQMMSPPGATGGMPMMRPPGAAAAMPMMPATGAAAMQMMPAVGAMQMMMMPAAAPMAPPAAATPVAPPAAPVAPPAAAAPVAPPAPAAPTIRPAAVSKARSDLEHSTSFALEELQTEFQFLKLKMDRMENRFQDENLQRKDETFQSDFKIKATTLDVQGVKNLTYSLYDSFNSIQSANQLQSQKFQTLDTDNTELKHKIQQFERDLSERLIQRAVDIRELHDRIDEIITSPSQPETSAVQDLQNKTHLLKLQADKTELNLQNKASKLETDLHKTLTFLNETLTKFNQTLQNELLETLNNSLSNLQAHNILLSINITNLQVKDRYFDYLINASELEGLLFKSRVKSLEEWAKKLDMEINNLKTKPAEPPTFAMLNLFSETDFKGLERGLSLTSCTNTSRTSIFYNKIVGSLKAHSTCVQLYRNPDCEGPFDQFHPGSTTSQSNNYGKIVLSAKPCLESQNFIF